MRVGELQPPGDVIGVFEQYLAGVRDAQSAPSPLEQAYADLGLQEGDLARYRRLLQREGLGGARERPLVGHRPEGQQPPWVHSLFLSDPKNQYWKLWGASWIPTRQLPRVRASRS